MFEYTLPLDSGTWMRNAGPPRGIQSSVVQPYISISADQISVPSKIKISSQSIVMTQNRIISGVFLPYYTPKRPLGMIFGGGIQSLSRIFDFPCTVWGFPYELTFDTLIFRRLSMHTLCRIQIDCYDVSQSMPIYENVNLQPNAFYIPKNTILVLQR